MNQRDYGNVSEASPRGSRRVNWQIQPEDEYGFCGFREKQGQTF